VKASDNRAGIRVLPDQGGGIQVEIGPKGRLAAVLTAWGSLRKTEEGVLFGLYPIPTLLNIYFHRLFPDRVYVDRSDGSAQFRWVKAPTGAELTHLANTIAHPVGRFGRLRFRPATRSGGRSTSAR